MAAILRDSVVVVVVAVVRMRPRAIPLAIITMRKSIHGFPFLPYMGMGLRWSSAINELLKAPDDFFNTRNGNTNATFR